MELGIRDRIALVTGSTAGIGFATARLLAGEGADVVVNGRTEARVEEAIARIREDFPSAQLTGIAADLGSAAGCRRLLERLPSVDILVNNVGIFEPKAFEEIPDEDWMRFFETNVLSGVRLSRHYLPRMRARQWGRIVFVSSESAVNIPAEMIHYGMTKTAQVAVARGIAETLARTGVTVNSVLAGPTASEGVTQFVGRLAEARGLDAGTMEGEFFATARPSSLLQRFLRPEEVAAAIVYLCSDLASGTTGSAIRADGGVVRSIL
jgi:NAD(P)-dependent dehydrogenase (short-subunit alcohol dehydrogenase family)